MALSGLIKLGGNSKMIIANKLDDNGNSFQFSQGKMCISGYNGRRTLNRPCEFLSEMIYCRSFI